MKENDYINAKAVKDFIVWISGKLDNPNSFIHTYEMKKPKKSWSCHSVYSAFENYCWPFSYIDPLSGDKITGKTYNDSSKSLTYLSDKLKKSIDKEDNQECKNYCCAILQWGGVLNHNDKRLDDLGESLCDYLKDIQVLFSEKLDSSEYYNKQIIMNSGFTKIYSLCAKDFIIYDGRVGAALGLLVRRFCEERELEKVPNELSFAWGRGKESSNVYNKENRRNPGNDRFIFSELLGNAKKHTENNIRANWLLKEILSATNTKFNELDNQCQLRALEAALFMMGYSVI